MPELPEVETIRRGLEEELVGHRITGFEVRAAKLFRGDKESLISQKVVSVSRRAKILIWQLDKSFLAIHLKMTGQLIFVSKDSREKPLIGGHPDEKYSLNLPHQYTHIIIRFDHGTLYYNDLRKFGWIRVCHSQKEVDKLIQDLGPEYDDSSFTLDYFRQRFQRRSKAKVKTLLMDQTLIAGLGNIYSDEVLFCAKINPTQSAGNLPPSAIGKLYKCIPQVLRVALKHGGSTLRDFRHVNGGYGSYLTYAKVYGQAKQPCKTCGTILKTVKVNGRTSTYCPHCQKQ